MEPQEMLEDPQKREHLNNIARLCWEARQWRELVRRTREKGSDSLFSVAFRKWDELPESVKDAFRKKYLGAFVCFEFRNGTVVSELSFSCYGKLSGQKIPIGHGKIIEIDAMFIPQYVDWEGEEGYAFERF